MAHGFSGDLYSEILQHTKDIKFEAILTPKYGIKFEKLVSQLPQFNYFAMCPKLGPNHILMAKKQG